jgi:hypothetical protein
LCSWISIGQPLGRFAEQANSVKWRKFIFYPLYRTKSKNSDCTDWHCICISTQIVPKLGNFKIVKIKNFTSTQIVPTARNATGSNVLENRNGNSTQRYHSAV